MANSAQKKIGYRDIVYNIYSKQFFSLKQGDNYEPIDARASGINSGGTGDRPTDPNAGDIYYDTDINQLIVFNGNNWETVGGGGGGSGYWVVSGNNLNPISNNYDVEIGGTLPSAPNIKLSADGSAEFGSGNIEVNADGSANFTADVTINSVTVGRGEGNINSNTVIGASAFAANTTGTDNVANGRAALFSNTEGDRNTGIGRSSMLNNETGDSNTAMGNEALYRNISGSLNTAIGRRAGYYIQGSSNTILGAYTGSSAHASLNNTVIISAGLTERARCDSNGDWDFGSIVLKSPNGTSFRLSVANDGTLSASAV